MASFTRSWAFDFSEIFLQGGVGVTMEVRSHHFLEKMVGMEVVEAGDVMGPAVLGRGITCSLASLA